MQKINKEYYGNVKVANQYYNQLGRGRGDGGGGRGQGRGIRKMEK